MPTTEIVFSLPPNLSREEIRKTMITLFLEEYPGTGKGENCSRYIYTVEQMQHSEKISLKRPAPLNKGFDFEVHVEGVEFRDRGAKRCMPKHDDIVTDFTEKKGESPSEYEKVARIINEIFLCQGVEDRHVRALSFSNGHAIESMLKATKWLFIEQDMTYWNWSGRSMFFNYLKSAKLC